MPDLNVDLDYFEHPKTLRLVGLLGKGSEVLPIKLWARVGKYHAENGRLPDYSAQEIESLVGWWGPSGKMVEALVKTGFLSQDEDGFFIHDWTAHQGHIWALKQRNQKAARSRWGGDAYHNAYQKDDPGIPQPTNQPTNQPKLTTILCQTPQTEAILKHFAANRGIGLSVRAVADEFRRSNVEAAVHLDRLTNHDTELAKVAIDEISRYLDKKSASGEWGEWRYLAAINNQYVAWKAEWDRAKEKKNGNKRPV